MHILLKKSKKGDEGERMRLYINLKTCAAAAFLLVVVYNNQASLKKEDKTLNVDPAFLNVAKKLPTPLYEIAPFKSDAMPWLTSEQVSQHMKLYQGYVNTRNDLAKKIKKTDPSQATSATYSEYRSMKEAEVFAMNADILHKLYFQNISGRKSRTPGTQMMELIIEAFGSVEDFKKDLIACGNSARGWVLTGYSLNDNRIHNFLLDAHNKNVPILVMPLLILDMYEHAYFLDFGTNKSAYIENFWNNINWDVVEDRINMWVNPLIKKSEDAQQPIETSNFLPITPKK